MEIIIIEIIMHNGTEFFDVVSWIIIVWKDRGIY